MPIPIAASNPHADEPAKALEYLKTLEASTDFVLASQGNTTTIWTKPPPADMEGNMPITKGQALLTKEGITLDQILDSLRNSQQRFKWDPRFEGLQIVEAYDQAKEHVLLVSLQKGQWPIISGRDFVVSMKKFVESETKGYVIQSSVVDSRHGEQKGRVRGHVYVAGWIVEKSGDGFLVTYISHVNPLNLPATLLNLIATETPACCGSFVRHVEKNGPFPADE
ncbi:hypothetical protein HDU78_005377 [Chytriomyces hyalinus]|nr:hypothetical protein HDU78_005377 [Chytriomyces hyalinus]